MTDNLLYNPALKPYETDGLTSGTLDDRWVFTPAIPSLNYSAIAAIAAASRALKEYNPALSRDALSTATEAWEKQRKEPMPKNNSRFAWFFNNDRMHCCTAALHYYEG